MTKTTTMTDEERAEHLASFLEEPEMNTYQELAGKTAFYPGRGTPLGLTYCALKLNGEAGEFAEHLGKAVRDNDFIMPGPLKDRAWYGKLTPERKELLLKELGDVLWYVANLAKELDTTLQAVAYKNLTKLYGRAIKGTLGGSGDDR